MLYALISANDLLFILLELNPNNKSHYEGEFSGASRVQPPVGYMKLLIPKQEPDYMMVAFSSDESKMVAKIVCMRQ